MDNIAMEWKGVLCRFILIYYPLIMCIIATVVWGESIHRPTWKEFAKEFFYKGTWKFIVYFMTFMEILAIICFNSI